MHRSQLRLVLSLSLLTLTAWPLSAQTEETDPKKLEFQDISKVMPMLMAPMRDGVRLATDVYLPKDEPGPFPVVFVKTPYGFDHLAQTTVIDGAGSQDAIKGRVNQIRAVIHRDLRLVLQSRGDVRVVGVVVLALN